MVDVMETMVIARSLTPNERCCKQYGLWFGAKSVTFKENYSATLKRTVRRLCLRYRIFPLNTPPHRLGRSVDTKIIIKSIVILMTRKYHEYAGASISLIA